MLPNTHEAAEGKREKNMIVQAAKSIIQQFPRLVKTLATVSRKLATVSRKLRARLKSYLL